MKTRQSPRLAILAGSLTILAAGCGDRAEENGARQPSGEVEQGGTVVLAEIADISNPVMIFANTALDGNLASDVLNMELLRGTWDDDALVYQTAAEHPMALARGYDYVGADSTALRFHLRSDVRWSDGQPVTAHDVVFTYDLVRNPAVNSPRVDYVENLDSVVAENDSTVRFHFSRRYAEMVSHAGIAPVPRHVFQGADPAQIRSHPAVIDPTTLPTSGPFRIGRWVKGQQITLVPNPHFQPRPNLDEVVIRIVPDATTRLVELQTGAVDFVPSVTFDQIANLRAQAPHVRFERQQKRFYDYIAYNPNALEAFADPEIRRALGMALNVPQMIEALQMTEYAVPAGGPYSPIYPELGTPEVAPPLVHDVERAKQILESKGWRDGDGDGVREKDGKPFRFTLLTNSGNTRRADASQIAQQQWKQIGVDAQLRQVEFNTFFTEAVIGKNFEAALNGWVVGLSPDYLATHFGPDSPYNLVSYRNPVVARAVEQALAQPTAEAATPFWKQAATQIAQDQPYTFLYYFDGVDGINDRVKGVEIDTYGPYQNLHEWWIPAGLRRPSAAPGAADSAGR